MLFLVLTFFGTTNNNNCNVPEVLGLALLWTCLEETQRHQIPPRLLQRVLDAFNSIPTINAAINQVSQICLAVYTVSGQLCIDKIISNGNKVGQPTNQHEGNCITQEQVNGISIQLQRTRLQMETALQAFLTLLLVMQQHYDLHFKTVNKKLHGLPCSLQGWQIQNK
jgi:hypothetical protein